MRIILIHNGDGLSSRGISGGTVRTLEIIRRWIRRPDIEAHGITTVGGSYKLQATGLNFPVTILKASLFGKQERFLWYRLVSYMISALDILRKERQVPPADLAFSASDFFCDTIVGTILRRRRPAIRWIASVHHLYSLPWTRPGNPLVNWGWFFLQRLSLRLVARHANVALVYDTEEGDRLAKLLADYGMSAHRIRRMCNGVDIKRYTAGNASVPKEFDAVFVGELRPNKGIFDIVPIWRRVCEQEPKARLHVVGHGAVNQMARLQSETREAGLEGRITFGGEQRGEQLLQAYSSARMFFMPSHEEGWGMAILEAMAAGLPVVAYDLPVYRRHYSGTVVTVPCFDVNEFAVQVVRLLRTDGGRAELSRRGRERSAHYDWDVLAEQDWQSAVSHSS
jgi:glycosyltransferase involved in cell wall biosynthesis